jgi:hypothetical protein
VTQRFAGLFGTPAGVAEAFSATGPLRRTGKALRYGPPQRSVGDMAARIRLAREDDLPRLREIERAAGRAFAALGMTEIAEDEPPSVEVLRGYRSAGRAWVHGDPAVAYLLAEPELTGGLRRIRRREAEHGLDRWPRVVMRRESAAP